MKKAKMIREAIYFLMTLYIMYSIARLLLSGSNFLINRTYNEGGRTEYDVILACQTISSQKTNEDWRYKDCLEELMGKLHKVHLLTL